MSAEQRLGLAEAVEALRKELTTAMNAGTGQLRFPVESVEISVNVGITKAVEGNAGVKFWVVELGSAGSYAREEVQTVTIKLGAPFGPDGKPINVNRSAAAKP